MLMQKNIYNQMQAILAIFVGDSILYLLLLCAQKFLNEVSYKNVLLEF